MHRDERLLPSEQVINKTLQEGHTEEKAASNKQVVWNLCSWLKRIDVTPILEKAILHQLHKFSSDPHLELIFMRHLAALGNSDESASQVSLILILTLILTLTLFLTLLRNLFFTLFLTLTLSRPSHSMQSFSFVPTKA